VALPFAVRNGLVGLVGVGLMTASWVIAVNKPPVYDSTFYLLLCVFGPLVVTLRIARLVIPMNRYFRGAEHGPPPGHPTQWKRTWLGSAVEVTAVALGFAYFAAMRYLM
jgi:hypothetical protein